MVKLIFGFAFSLILFSCNSSSDLINSQTKEVQFQLLDSLVVESLSELYLVGKHEESGRFLFKDKFVNEILLTDSKGRIIASPKLKGEGPDQVGQPWDVAFAGNEIVVKEFSPEMRIHFFDTSFKKLRVSDPLAQGINLMEVAPTRAGLSSLDISGKKFLLGTEVNAVASELMAADQQNVGFYSKAESGYVLEVVSGKPIKLNLYPDSWQPKKEGNWVGPAYPFLAATSKNKIVGILPRIGDQIFFFRLNGSELNPVRETLINHPDRKRGLVFNPADEPLLYPSFFDLKAGGSLFLVHFYTEVPREPYLTLKAQGKLTTKNPEYVELMRENRKSKYIFVDEKGNQAPISKLPIEGQIHFMDSEDVIYIKPDSKQEKDYNVFYRYKVKL